jgi:hypothetical protein
MTRVDLQTRLQIQFNNPTYYDIQAMNDSIQDGMDEVAAFTGCIYSSATLPFTGNKTYYDFNTILGNYIGVVAIFNTVINRWLIPTSIKHLDQVRIDWESAYGTPYYFVPVNHRYVAIYKKPQMPGYGNMFVYYIASAPTLNDATTIPIPDDHITALESYCIKDLWEQNQEFTKASDHMQTYVTNMEILRVYMKNRRNSDRQASLR